MIFVILSRYFGDSQVLQTILHQELDGLWEGHHTFHFTLNLEETLTRVRELAPLGERVVVIAPAYWAEFRADSLRTLAHRVKEISPSAWFIVFDDISQSMKSDFLIDGFITSGRQNEVESRHDQLLRFLLVCVLVQNLSEVRGRLPWLSIMED